LSWHGLNPVKLAHTPSWPDDWPQKQPTSLTSYMSVPTVVVTGTNVMQNSPFLL